MPIVPCTPTTPVRGVVTFDPTLFKVAYPEFASAANASLLANFGLAQLVLNNSCRSLVCDATKRETLLNLLVAHVTQLRNGMNGQQPGGLVGRVSQATEGSVSVSAEFPTNPGAAWFLQTAWGALYWQATSQYRTMRYIPPPCRPCVSSVFGCNTCGAAGGCACG